MSTIDHKQFIELPDWKKMELISKKNKFRKYPIQTQEQEYSRKIAILKLCAHYTSQNLKELITSINSGYSDIWFVWPRAMELFLTPRLLDSVSIDLLCYYGNCYCCENYSGYNKMDYKLVRHSNIVPLFGVCGELIKDKRLTPALYRVSPNNVCIAWNPMPLCEQIIDYSIHNLFAENKTNGYEYSDYQMDLKSIDFWAYFYRMYDM